MARLATPTIFRRVNVNDLHTTPPSFCVTGEATAARQKRRNVLGLIAVCGLASAGIDNRRKAQSSPGTPRIGVLSPQKSTEPPAVQRIHFEQGLRELGWTPDRNVVIEYRYAEGDIRRLPALAAELIELGVDVIVARSPPAIHAAQQATATVPIVMAASAEPVREGFVRSLGRPGGNITGLAIIVDDLGAKQLELLKMAVPTLRHVAILVNPTMKVDQDIPFLARLDSTARALAARMMVMDLSRPEDIPMAFAAIEKARVDALLVRADPLLLEPHAADVVALATAHRLPAIYPWRIYVDAGGLMSYATALSKMHWRSAAYVDKILKGAKPANLPVEQPLVYELIVNLKAADAIGLAMPTLLLFQATEVIR